MDYVPVGVGIAGVGLNLARELEEADVGVAEKDIVTALAVEIVPDVVDVFGGAVPMPIMVTADDLVGGGARDAGGLDRGRRAGREGRRALVGSRPGNHLHAPTGYVLTSRGSCSH